MQQANRTERRGQTRQVVDKLINERAELLVLYCRAAGIESWHDVKSADITEPVDAVVEEFCQTLVDYLAAGHFTLYQRIAAGEERRQQVVDIAADTYPAIAATTQRLLDFNDAYQSKDAAQDRARLATDLSSLGEQLALRVELEDRLLKALL